MRTVKLSLTAQRHQILTVRASYVKYLPLVDSLLRLAIAPANISALLLTKAKLIIG